MNESVKKIRDFLLEAYQVDPNDIKEDDNLVDAGIVDSSGILELIDFLEGEFMISIADEDIAEDHFQSIKSISMYIDNKQKET